MKDLTDPKKPSLLIVNPVHQYGYGAGYAYYPQYLNEDFEIHFICLDKGLPKIDHDGFEVIYMDPGHSLSRVRTIFFTLFTIRHVVRRRYDSILCVYFSFSFLIGLFGRSEKKIVDIRTGSLKRSALLNRLTNMFYKFSTFPFDRILVISDSLLERMNLSRRKTTVLPLGGESIDRSEKEYNAMQLVYVGVFTGRNIDQTIEGLKMYLEKRQTSMPVHYDIIGFGLESDLERMDLLIQNAGLKDIVTVHKKMNHLELVPFFKQATIGVAFVPMTPFFHVQPSTKVFEYALSGLITVATNTKENARVITTDNGRLCDDSASGFADALLSLELELNSFDEKKIRNSLSEYHWEVIVHKKLSKILKGDE